MEAPSKLTLLLAGGLVTLMSATGCGGADSEVGGYGSGAGGAEAQEEAPSAEENEESGTGATLTVQEDTQLGEVIADSNGQTLYVYTEDSTEPPTSNCEGECAEQWPPAWANGEISTNGVDQSLVGEVQREDGDDSQITLSGWPLYTYAGDSAPGDLNGHAYEGTWYALAPNGSMIDGVGETGGGQDSASGNQEGGDGNDGY